MKLFFKKSVSCFLILSLTLPFNPLLAQNEDLSGTSLENASEINPLALGISSSPASGFKETLKESLEKINEAASGKIRAKMNATLFTAGELTETMGVFGWLINMITLGSVDILFKVGTLFKAISSRLENHLKKKVILQEMEKLEKSSDSVSLKEDLSLVKELSLSFLFNKAKDHDSMAMEESRAIFKDLIQHILKKPLSPGQPKKPLPFSKEKKEVLLHTLEETRHKLDTIWLKEGKIVLSSLSFSITTFILSLVGLYFTDEIKDTSLGGEFLKSVGYYASFSALAASFIVPLSACLGSLIYSSFIFSWRFKNQINQLESLSQSPSFLRYVKFLEAGRKNPVILQDAMIKYTDYFIHKVEERA
jgi:hypothetical protein